MSRTGGELTVKYARPVVVVLLCLCALAFGAGQAQAHNVLVSTQPAAGSTIHTGPSEIRLTFDKPVQFGFTDVEVLGPGRTYWAARPPAISGDTVTAALRELGPAGEYTIQYRIVSADGHPVSGQASFTLAVAGSGQPANGPVGGRTFTTTPATVTPAGQPPAWLWLAGGAVIAVALGLLLARRLSR